MSKITKPKIAKPETKKLEMERLEIEDLEVSFLSFIDWKTKPTGPGITYLRFQGVTVSRDQAITCSNTF